MKEKWTINALLSEGRSMQPATVLTRRGTVIQADHVRWLVGRTGMKFLAIGINPGIRQSVFVKPTRKIYSALRKARDFSKPPSYTPSWDQDDTGWSEPVECRHCYRYLQNTPEAARAIEVGRPEDVCQCPMPIARYDAHRDLVLTFIFKTILTVQEQNVVELKLL